MTALQTERWSSKAVQVEAAKPSWSSGSIADDAVTEDRQHLSGPNVLLVSDNRDNPNWGSRASTMALLAILEQAGLPPTDRVMDSAVRAFEALADHVVVDRALRLPTVNRVTTLGWRRGGRTQLFLERVLGIHAAVGDDPAETLRRWRRSGREPMASWITQVERADALIVNGEGSMIFTTPSRNEQRFHLAMMQLAYEASVPFFYVNALVADPAHGPRNTASFEASSALLPHAQLVTTRDPESLDFLLEMAAGVNAAYIPDAAFAWHGRLTDDGALRRPEYLLPFHDHPDWLGHWDFRKPYICVGGSSEAAKNPERARISYRRLLVALPELGYPVVVTVSCLGDTFLEELAHELHLPLVPARTNVLAAAQILANAELVVTGRYHPAILAGLGGVPCVLLGADSHKTRSVQVMLGYPEITVFPEHPSGDDILSILERARSILHELPRWRSAIAAAAAARATEARSLSASLSSYIRSGDAP